MAREYAVDKRDDVFSPPSSGVFFVYYQFFTLLKLEGSRMQLEGVRRKLC